MMDIWWKLRGYVRLRLTSADWPARLRALSEQGHRLDGIHALDALTVEFTVLQNEFPAVARILGQGSDRVELLGRGGLPHRFRGWIRDPMIPAVLALITAATLWLPGRILHIAVEGNGPVPQRLILEAAAEQGICFGAERREIRSEQVKNALLQRIPELGWVGVNTSGCQAVITVRPRSVPGAGETESVQGDLIAVRDALVTEVTVTCGTGICGPGQIVREGQVLISGYSDLGLCTRAEGAGGEVWGVTNRQIRSVVPGQLLRMEPTGEIVKKYSVLLGKKRINFHSDSGILHGTCGKMREVIWLTLPGGWELPLGLVVERYILSQSAETERPDAEALLRSGTEQTLKAQMIGGEIRTEFTSVDRVGSLWVLDGVYECHEMIARPRSGVYLEGDTNDDRENGERRTG